MNWTQIAVISGTFIAGLILGAHIGVKVGIKIAVEKVGDMILKKEIKIIAEER